MDLYNTILELCKTKGINITTMCKECGASRGALGDLKSQKKKSLSSETLAKIADYFGVTVDYLLGKTEKSANNVDALDRYGIFPITYKKFRVLGEIACGKPIYADEDRETVILADSNINADFCLYAKGDSMIGARIMDGDIVFIKNQPTVENGEIAAVIIGDEATLKRVYYYPEQNKISLNAENPKYAPLIYDGEELNTIRILGKAVAFQSTVK